MVSIFLRSLAYNVLFYALLVFWILVALPTFLMPRRAFMAVAKEKAGAGDVDQIIGSIPGLRQFV